MATLLSVFRHPVFSRFCRFNIASQIQAAKAIMPVRCRSNALSLTKIRRACYPRAYPTMLVFPDGSTVNIRYKEPRKIIKLPLDFSKLTDEEKKRVVTHRKPKQKLEKIEEFGEAYDLSEYSKFFKS